MIKKIPITKELGMGNIRGFADSRRIQLAAFQSPVVLPKEYMTDISMLPVENQGSLPSCVGNAMAKIMQYQHYKETGVITPLSWRFVYGMSKTLDGMEGEGTYIATGSKVAIEIGATEAKTTPNDISLTHAKFIDIERNPAIFREAMTYKQKAVAFAESTVYGMKQAIIRNGLVAAGIGIGAMYQDSAGYYFFTPGYVMSHAMVYFGWKDMPDGTTRFYHLNSWGQGYGKNGVGYIGSQDYFGIFPQIWDICTFTDVPQPLIEEAKRRTYKPAHEFIFNLTAGQSSDDVKILQDILKYEGCLSTVDVPVSTRFYGAMTAAALLKLQLRYEVAANDTLYQLAGKSFGPATRALINSFYAPLQTSKIDIWAKAIQIHEGYYAPGEKSAYPNGSVSWRNNNPGNIKYSRQARAVGKDANNFAVFSSYADGMDELKDMLRRACMGKSTTYKPTMTLLQFFQTYAPASDANNPYSYASMVAKALKVDVNIKIKELL